MGGFPVKRITFLFILITLAGLLMAQSGEEDLLTNADTAFREGRYGESANLYQEAAVRGAVNSAVYYNQGNSWFMAGELNLAHLSYLKAEALKPGDGDIKRNLSYVRALTAEENASDGKGELLRVLFFWHYDLSPRFRSFLLLAANILFWTVLFLFLFLRRRKRILPLWSVLLSALLLIAVGSSVLISRTRSSRYPRGLLMEETSPHKGDGESFGTAFNRPLPGGTEFQLRDKRSDWYKIRLNDGSEGWIKEESAELVTFP
jgi:tetratricopeptide (TPR) repeat protein